MGIEVISITPALAGLIMPRKMPRVFQAWLLAGLASFLFVWLLGYLPILNDYGPVEINHPWVPELGLTISFYLDGLSLLFGLLITGIGAAIILYAGYYFEDVDARGRFYALLLSFMSAMLGLVMAGNILTLFIAWELTSIVSFLLISFNSESEEARTGALRALIITAGGGLALFVGLLMLGTAAQTMQISELLSNETLRTHPWYTAFTLLIFIGCFSKSAQFPLHFWLPGAMSAPTPASAYLHSATMVKAGIYLLVRFYPVLGDTPLWETTLLWVGLSTMAIGAVLALRQNDLKAALAYSTISQLGTLTALASLHEGEGIKALLVGILAHSLYKAALFMMVGAVDHKTGTRKLDRLGGLRHDMPEWAVITIIAGFSMAGIPPLLGFVAKEALLESLLANPVALAIVVFSAALTVAMALILVWHVFFGAAHKQAHHHEEHSHSLPQGMVVGPATLVMSTIFSGVLLEALIVPILTPALGHHVELYLFHGFNLPLLLSVVAVAGGVFVFVTRPSWSGWFNPALPNGTSIYNGIVSGVERVGDLALRSQDGKIRYYLVSILTAMSLLMCTAGLTHVSEMNWTFEFNGAADLFKTLLLVIALAAMFGSIIFKRHLIAALCLGLAGYSVGGVFLLEPAPDVALVQFLVETLGTVLLIVMLAKISTPAREQAIESIWKGSKAGLARDIAISAAIGIGVTLFALAAVLNRPEAETVTLWHMENAFPELGFSDIVGAIVTDFRGMDTIIEITVFGMAALGVFTLLNTSKGNQTLSVGKMKSMHKAGRRILRINTHVEMEKWEHVHSNEEEIPLGSHFSTPLTRTVVKMVLPFALLLALAQLLYGGDGPGDGFTAGVTSGLGIAMWYIVFGYHESRERLQWLRPRRLIGCGIGLVILNAIFPLFLGMPFLAHVSFDIHLPANLHLSSTLIYETGIFLTVLGSSSMVVEAIAYPKELEAQ